MSENNGTSGDVEILGMETMTKEEVVGQLARIGLSPSVIAQTTGVSSTQVKAIIRRRTTTTLPDDPVVTEAWRGIELEAIDHIRRTIRFGTQQDRMSLLKIIAGRALSRRGGETSEQFEEMRMAWDEIREEQRDIPPEVIGEPIRDWEPEHDEVDDDWDND